MRSLLFDFGGTLDSDGLTWLDRFHGIYKEAGLAPDRDGFARAFYASDDELPSRHELGGLSLDETVALQVDGVLERLDPARRGEGPALAARFVSESREHLRRNRAVLERLASRFRLGVVSNFYGNLEGLLRAEGLLDLFGAVADSGALGATKPGPEIFRHALEGLACPPSEALMVGDSVPRDMRGAEALGMAHALLAPPAAPSCCPRALRMSRLPELEALLP